MATCLEIHEAAATGDLDTLEEYLKTGKLDVNQKDEEWGDRTALHWACAKGYVECIRLLLDHGAAGTSRTDTGWTPAHMAAEAGKLTALRALFNANVPIGLKDNFGDRPRRIAEIYGHLECVRLLEQCEIEQARNPTGMSSRVGSMLKSRRLQAARQVPVLAGISKDFMKLAKSGQSKAGTVSPTPGINDQEQSTNETSVMNDSEHTTETASNTLKMTSLIKPNRTTSDHHVADDGRVSDTPVHPS